MIPLLTKRQLEICNVYRRLFFEGRAEEIEAWCLERGISGREFSEALCAMHDALEAQEKLLRKQLARPLE